MVILQLTIIYICKAIARAVDQTSGYETIKRDGLSNAKRNSTTQHTYTRKDNMSCLPDSETPDFRIRWKVELNCSQSQECKMYLDDGGVGGRFVICKGSSRYTKTNHILYIKDTMKRLGDWNNVAPCKATGTDDNCGPGIQQQKRTCTDGAGKYESDVCTGADREQNISCGEAGTALQDCTKTTPITNTRSIITEGIVSTKSNNTLSTIVGKSNPTSKSLSDIPTITTSSAISGQQNVCYKYWFYIAFFVLYFVQYTFKVGKTFNR